jgi:hypothetical protein
MQHTLNAVSWWSHHASVSPTCSKPTVSSSPADLIYVA